MRRIAYNLKQILVLTAVTVASLLVLTERASPQCVEHPDGKTAVILKNDTKHDVMFRIDDSDKGTVPSKRSSQEWEVTPGEHLLVAAAVIEGRMYWVWTENEVRKGQICTWTLFDPERVRAVDGVPILQNEK